MVNSDRYGNSLSCASSDAAEAYRDGVDLMLSAWTGADACFRKAIELDPDFALAYAALARLSAMQADMAAARFHISEAERLVEPSGDEREKAHVRILALAQAGKAGEAIAGVLEHVELWPRDVIILSLPLGAFGLYAFSGMRDHNQAKADLCERVAGAYGANDWWFLNYNGWSIAENGEVARGRAMLERAMSIRVANANGAHALAHCMVEAGEISQTEAHINAWLPSYEKKGILHGHIAWHLALAMLEQGNSEAALSVYRDLVSPDVSRGLPINVVTDGASFLWRYDLYDGAAPKADWKTLSAYAADRFPNAGHAFVDTHMAMAFAGAGEADRLEQRLSDLAKLVAANPHQGLPVASEIGRALNAVMLKDHEAAADVLEPLMIDVSRIGGSNAQRDVIEDTLIVSLIRSGQSLRADRLVEARLARRPSVRDANWKVGLAST